MTPTKLSRRTSTVAVLVGLFWVGLLVRVGQLQSSASELRTAANSQRMTSIEVPTTVGRILDREQRPLAVSLRQGSVFANPSRIDDPQTFAQAVAPVLELDANQLASILANKSTQQFRWLKRRVPTEVIERLDALDLPRGTWGVRNEFRRVYPQGNVAAHLLGLRGLDGETHGGIEAQFADVMTGQAGRQRQVQDSRGRPLSLLTSLSVAPQPGRDVRLTLDARLSAAVGLRLDELMAARQPAWAVAIVMDPRSGNLLTVETRPTYDPNDPTGIAAAGFHHAFHATFEPGSTVKPLVVAAALDAGVVTPNSVVDCGPGRDHVAGRPMKDAVPLYEQPLAMVLAKSSNIGVARIAEQLGAERFYENYRQFGFGRPVPNAFRVDSTGRLRPPSEWSGYSLGSLAMGHELSVTPLQLITAYATLTQGRTVTPQLIVQNDPVIDRGQPLVSRETSAWITGAALREAVLSGTAKSLRLDGIEVFGKTGTAQKYDAERGAYRTDRATCVVVGGAPADQPTRLVLVVVDDPTIGPPFSGGRVAGPVGRDILKLAIELQYVHSPVN